MHRPTLPGGLLAAMLALAALAAAPHRSAAQDESEPAWAQTLRDQLEQDEHCSLAYLTDVREFEFHDGVVANGRAHCMDKRQFDFTWAPKEMRFDFKRCGPQVC